jgi:hypothetical protein
VHLAVDVANAPLALDQVGRFVSRSRSRAVYEASRAEVEQLMRAIRGGDGAGAGEGEDLEPLVLDWDVLYEEDGYDAFDPFDAFGQERSRDTEPTPVEDRAVTVHGFGTRVSGMTFSPGGDISMVLYDKVLQTRLSGKRHMEPIWAAAGWQMGVPVTRHEARLRRRAVRELGLVGEARSCLDDPWEFLTHVKDMFAAVVGRSDPCPDAVDVAWIRRVGPDASDANRSRWPTDPIWQVVQRATFADGPAEVRRLIRRRQRGGDVQVLDTVQYGCLVSRVAQLHPNGGAWTLSRALGEALPSLEALEAHKTRAGKDFGELVRERRRQRGLPLPLAEKVLPFRPATSEAYVEGSVVDKLPPDGMDAEVVAASSAEDGGEMRLAAAWNQLAAAEQRQASARELQALESAFFHEARGLVSIRAHS